MILMIMINYPLGFPGTHVPICLARAKRADATMSGEKGTAFLINKSCKSLNEYG